MNQKGSQFFISWLQPKHHYPEVNSRHFASLIFYDVHTLIAVFADCLDQGQLTNVSVSLFSAVPVWVQNKTQLLK